SIRFRLSTLAGPGAAAVLFRPSWWIRRGSDALTAVRSECPRRYDLLRPPEWSANSPASPSRCVAADHSARANSDTRQYPRVRQRAPAALLPPAPTPRHHQVRLSGWSRFPFVVLLMLS